MSKLPSKSALIDWIAQQPSRPGLRDIARAFGIKGGADKVDLKRLLAALEADGAYQRRPRRAHSDGLPPIGVIRVTGPDAQGDLGAEPAEAAQAGAAVTIRVVEKAGQPALGAGDRVLAKLLPTGPDSYDAHPIRKLQSSAPSILGIFRAGPEGGRILPIDKGEDREWRVPKAEIGGARDGELVEAERIPGPRSDARMGLPRARITQRLGNPGAPRAVSLIAIHQHGIPDRFPDDVLAEAEAAGEPTGHREDLREDLRALDFVTIDPSDARDHDDAVHAMPDPESRDGFIVWVAIADVAAYVRPGSALDDEARTRGNSSYFPDRVVPMLPDRLSGDLCSLHEGVDRPVIAVRLSVDAQGNKTGHRFARALIRSRASLSYEQAQAAFDGQLDAATEPLAPMLSALNGAWRATLIARAQRQPLDLDLPERRIVLDDAGQVTSVAFKDRLDAHKVIEEFMVMANVAAAETLLAKRVPLLFRVHEEPALEKLDALREVVAGIGLRLAKGQVLHTRHLNALLAQAATTPFAELVNMSTLRSMTQAYYSPEHLGHFGLALRSYAHFTSPIRRYADLIVHRALITAHGWGDDGLSETDKATLAETATQISETERRSMAAERDTTDRYLAAFMADRLGATFQGAIAGVARFGLFVKLDETGADGLVPIRSLGDEYFRHDPESQTLTGERSGKTLGLGQRVSVKLAEADGITGGLILELLEVEGQPLARARSRGRRPTSSTLKKAKRLKDRKARTRSR